VIGRTLKLSAAAACLLYVLVQAFQWWVFSRLPGGHGAVADFLDGRHPLNIYRSSSMLLAMYGLLFIYFVTCFANYRHQAAGTILAFLGFFIFGLLEIVLRSTELFYVQLKLPAEYLSSLDPERQQAIMDAVKAFQEIQHALYFPLGLSQLVGSLILVAIVPTSKVNRVIRFAFLFNALRLFLRMVSTYLGFEILGDKAYSAAYLPMVVLIFGLNAWWLVRSSRADASPTG
jgi:hypothetical protein